MLINKYEDKKVEDCEKSNYESMTSYKNPFQKHE